MNKLSKRDIELFVAGALALLGFRVLIGLPYYFSVASPMISMRLISSLLTALALPVGIAILLGRTSAISCAQIYLWIMLLTACIAIPLSYHLIPELSGSFVWRTLPELLVDVVLLALIFWTRSRRFRNEPDA